MFAILFDSVGFGEWFILLAVILIVVGPKRLPGTARKFGQYYSKFRRAAESFKRQLMDMDTEISRVTSDLQKSVNETLSSDTDSQPATDPYTNIETSREQQNEFPYDNPSFDDPQAQDATFAAEMEKREAASATEANPEVANSATVTADAPNEAAAPATSSAAASSQTEEA